MSTVQDFLQQSSILEPHFYNQFKKNHRGQEIHYRNVTSLTESKPALKSASKANLIEASSKKKFAREVSNQLFDKVKPRNAPYFSERSKSVMEPSTFKNQIAGQASAF